MHPTSSLVVFGAVMESDHEMNVNPSDRDLEGGRFDRLEGLVCIMMAGLARIVRV